MKRIDWSTALSSAIVNQAMKDLGEARRKLQDNPQSEAAENSRREISSFFKSDWFSFLCDVNPDLEKVRDKEVIA
jgi:hypothetical protein